jgi:O-antigen/teichoic acid export membrane protein
MERRDYRSLDINQISMCRLIRMERIRNLLHKNTKSPFVRNTVIVMGGSVIANVLAYGYHVVIGRILGPVQYGELGALLSLFYILNVPSGVIQTGLTKYFSVLKARNNIPQTKELFIRSLKILAIGGTVCFLLLTPFLPFFAKFLQITNVWNLVTLYGVFFAYLLIVPATAYLTGYQLFFTSVVITNISAFLRIVCGSIGAFFGVTWTLFANILSNLATAGMMIVPLKNLLKEKQEPLHISNKKVLAYGLPMMIALLAGTSLYTTDVVLVKHFFDAHSAGIYTSLSVLGKVIFFASFAITSVLFPTIAEKKEKGGGYGRILWMGAGSVAAISALVTTGYFLFPTQVVHLLFGSAYDEAIVYVGWFGLFLSFVSLSTLFIQAYLAASRTIVSYIAAGAAIIQIFLIWIYHDSIMQVIQVNIGVTAGLSVLLALGALKSKDI